MYFFFYKYLSIVFEKKKQIVYHRAMHFETERKLNITIFELLTNLFYQNNSTEKSRA